MVAAAVSIAESVKTMLAAATLSQPFTVERSYADWEFQLEQAGSLRVDVAPHTTKQEVELVARGGKLAYTVPIDVCIRKKFGVVNDDAGRIPNAEIDPLMYLTQEIHQLFVQIR